MSNTIDPKSDLKISEVSEVTEVNQEQEDLELSDEQLENVTGASGEKQDSPPPEP